MLRHLTVLLLTLALIGAGCNLSASSNPPPTPDKPQIRFVEPANNARVLAGTDLTIDLYALDETLGVARIELRVDGRTLRDAAPEEDVAKEFRVEMNWLAQGVGRHVLSAIAYRPNGITSDETFISIEVVQE